jgi:hypothetical protein
VSWFATKMQHIGWFVKNAHYAKHYKVWDTW